MATENWHSERKRTQKEQEKNKRGKKKKSSQCRICATIVDKLDWDMALKTKKLLSYTEKYRVLRGSFLLKTNWKNPKKFTPEYSVSISPKSTIKTVLGEISSVKIKDGHFFPRRSILSFNGIISYLHADDLYIIFYSLLFVYALRKWLKSHFEAFHDKNYLKNFLFLFLALELLCSN